MTAYLEYHLVNGFVHNWLVAGPHVLPVMNVESQPGDENTQRSQIYHKLPEEYREQSLDLSVSPLEMVEFEAGGVKLAWRYLRCMGDHLVDLTAAYPLWKHLCAWAHTMLRLPSVQKATLTFTTQGPITAWLNGRQIVHHEDFHLREKVGYSVEADLQEGENQVLVRFEMVGVRESPFTLALKVVGLPEKMEKDVVVMIATQAKYPRRHELLEETFERAYLEEPVNYRGAHINLHWAEAEGPKMRYAFQMLDKEGWNYVEGFWETDPEKPFDVGHGFRLKEKSFFVNLQPVILEFFDHNLRYEKKFPIYVIDNAYANVPTGTFAERNREALEDATKHSTNLYGEIAKMALGRWTDFNADLVLDHIQKVNRREAGSEVTLLGLLGILYRYARDTNFSEKLKRPLENCIINFRYWEDESSTAGGDGLVFRTESGSLLFHTCQVLAGQLYPQRTFTCSGNKGKALRQKGEALALEWLRLRGAQGFQDWDSNETFEKDLLALSHLTSLAEDDTLHELAAVMMDKIFFSMAVNSFKGSFGSTHGITSASMLKSSQLEATSGISRMMWGTGVYNSHILGTVALATSNYDFPLLIGEIANDTSSIVWNKERHVVDHLSGCEVNKVTYKTPHYMLCSAQDYRPGERGEAEHIWQATLGSDAVVFVNHPACIGDTEEHRPGFWLGNQVLPRVAQWKDVLVAVHRLPEDDWMGYTHAYFPVYMFSEYEIISDQGKTWAFARKDNGYLALTASQGFELVKRAPDGYRELRSYGRENVWLCHMGRRETDGSFEHFIKRILAMKLGWQDLGLHCKTLRNEYLSFGWEGPLLVNGKEKPLRGFKHHESSYSVVDLPGSQMDIQSNGTVMRLDFS